MPLSSLYETIQAIRGLMMWEQKPAIEQQDISPFVALPSELKLTILQYVLRPHRISALIPRVMGDDSPISRLSHVSKEMRELSHEAYYRQVTAVVKRVPIGGPKRLMHVPSTTIAAWIHHLEVQILIENTMSRLLPSWTTGLSTVQLNMKRDLGVLLRPRDKAIWPRTAWQAHLTTLQGLKIVFRGAAFSICQLRGWYEGIQECMAIDLGPQTLEIEIEIQSDSRSSWISGSDCNCRGDRKCPQLLTEAIESLVQLSK